MTDQPETPGHRPRRRPGRTRPPVRRPDGKRPGGQGPDRTDPGRIDVGTSPPPGPVWVPTRPELGSRPGTADPFDLGAWSPDVPLLLVPVRLETKYVTTGSGDELRIRIVPDPISVRRAASASERELEEGRDFWTGYHAATSPDQRAATWRQFAQRLGTNRCGYVARLTRPAVGADGHLTFPEVKGDDATPGLASLLPRRWLVTGWVGDKIAFQQASGKVVGPLAVSPDPTATASPLPGSGLRIDPAIAWLFDYEEAERRGMAVTVPLSGDAETAADGVSTLIVVGLDDELKPPQGAHDLTELLDEHARADGLAFVPQGTPTNNTANVPSGHRREETELAALEQRELGVQQGHVDDNASRLARALGFADAEPLLRVAFGTDREFGRSRDMRIALFESVLGVYLREMLAVHEIDRDTLSDGIGDAAIATLRSWFVSWVTGGAPVPSLRVGPQPYGILPVMPGATFDAHVDDGSEIERRITEVIDLLIEEWRFAVASVPVLDHDATDELGDTPDEASAAARDIVASVLANNPHPRRVTLRSADDWSDQPRPELPTGRRSASAMESTRLSWERETSDLVFGSDGFSYHVPIPVTGGFRWEYQHAHDELDSTYATTLRQLYDLVIEEIVEAGGIFTPGQPGIPAAREFVPGTRPATEDDIRGIEEQLAVWIQTDASIDDPRAINVEYGQEVFDELHEFATDVIEQLERHELRQRPLRWLEVPHLDGVLGRDDLQLLLTKFGSSTQTVHRALVQEDEPPGGVTSEEYLESLSARAGAVLPGGELPGGGPIGGGVDPTTGAGELPIGGSIGGQIELPARLVPLSDEFTESPPLLYQMIDATLSGATSRQELSAALDRLAGVAPEQLDWLVRECLGLGMHRLDAWHTSFASRRLSTMRDAAPEGLYIGSFGVVLDLARSDDRRSQGFVHAPSLPHAASAAVLRSGWLARGSDDPESPAAIDLTSGRLREADWLLSGVRHGQDLGALLGAAFERALHDATPPLDAATRPIRQAVIDAHELSASADVPVDGILLLDLHRETGLENTIGELGLGSVDKQNLTRILAALDAAFDAVDDATTFEAVHQLVIGNLERAAAVLDGAGPEGGRPPELLGVRTPRGALTVDVRALILLEAGAIRPKGSWPTGTRDLFDPELDAWVAAMLPPPADIGFTATAGDGNDVSLRVKQLATSPLDFCALASDDPTTMTPGLRRLAELAAGGPLASVDPTDAGDAPISLAEAQLLAIELRRLVDECVPATERSLQLADQVERSDAGRPDEAASVGLAAVTAAYDAAGEVATWSKLSDDVSAALARLGIVPSPNIDQAIDFAAVRARIERRRAAADRIAVTAKGDVAAFDATRELISTLAGIAVPLLAPFEVPAADAVLFDTELASDDELDDWLDLNGTVHTRLGMLGRAIDLSGLLGRTPPTLAAAQGPLVEGDRWAALHLPAAGTGGRVAVASVTHGNVDAGGQVVGLVVDRWSERIPHPDQVTGVAFHVDAPSCEAPQSMLLAVPPEGEQWSTGLVLDAVLETIEWMQLRAVSLDDLGDYGHALPTTFVPVGLDGSEIVGVSS